MKKTRNWGWLLLFTTSGTLICCAIPLVLVSVGLGAAVASMASAAPWLIKLSMYKTWVFAISGCLILLALWSVHRPGRSCPTDPVLAAACERVDKWNRRFVVFSGVAWSIGFFAAFLLPIFV